ncbi:patatin-like phospholipase family protein [Aestuariicella hydrocarbonica]|uniref:Patatin-like phospholipase family protein n=1 Tax=Pseudomaricurvus hydrocarbonicus TaxID=1470433 RepID=A0A9E5MQ22_9GAMM|nr:patatin-like phospholipase family protein [Aestuariicella hydrocarbonica]NHO68346.1 patatin-like phospholipase family protein [Aestuariicella hydrocarbonica]
MTLLTIRAGASAYRQIQRDGLAPEHISSVFGASGAAKWLAIYGLDRAIFSQWLAPVKHPINLFGTSVGAFKLAAACHRDAGRGLDALAEAYIQQSYPKGVTADTIELEFRKILQVTLGDDKVGQILSHPTFRFGCGAVRCHGGLASANPRRQTAACSRAAVKNMRGRAALRNQLERVVFHDPRASFPLDVHDGRAPDGYRTETVALNEENLPPGLKASGSIPVYMHGVKDIPGAGAGVYRDGGLLDYHPVPGNFWRAEEGLILYPHFYPDCKEGWFDKFLPWRKAAPHLLDRAVLIYPTPRFFAATQLGRVPDRQDFARFADSPSRPHNNAERIRLWQEVADKSHLLGQEFLQLSDSGELAKRVRPLGL